MRYKLQIEQGKYLHVCSIPNMYHFLIDRSAVSFVMMCYLYRLWSVYRYIALPYPMYLTTYGQVL